MAWRGTWIETLMVIQAKQAADGAPDSVTETIQQAKAVHLVVTDDRYSRLVIDSAVFDALVLISFITARYPAVEADFALAYFSELEKRLAKWSGHKYRPARVRFIAPSGDFLTSRWHAMAAEWPSELTDGDGFMKIGFESMSHIWPEAAWTFVGVGLGLGWQAKCIVYWEGLTKMCDEAEHRQGGPSRQ